MTSLAEATSEPRFRGLDGLRGIAILMVMWGHFAPQWAVEGDTWSRWLATVMNTGWAGVDLFFVLSGFLITDLLLRSRGEGPHRPAAWAFFSAFFMRRFLRIVPLYLFALAGTAAWVALYGTPAGRYAWHELSPWLWTFTTNFGVAREGWAFKFDGALLNHFWSLAVEEQFYLLWPVMVYVCRHRTLVHACVATLLLSPILRYHYAANGNSYAAFALMPCRADTFAVGSLLAIAIRTPLRRPRLLSVCMMTVGGAAALLAFLSPLWTDLAGRSAMAVFFGGAVLAGLQTAASRAFDLRALKWLGKYSYAIYVLHFLLYHPLNRLFPESLGTPLRFVGCVATSSLLACASWHLLESRFLRLKSYFPMPVGVASPAPHSMTHADRPGVIASYN